MGKDKVEFEELFTRHHRELLDLAFNILRDKDGAQDVVQEVFVQLWKNRDTLDFGAQIKHYLFKATSHTALNQLRSHRKLFRLEDHTSLATIMANPGTETASFNELDQQIRQAIDRLPPQCKAVFILSRHEGLKYQEIADVLGLSIKTIENQMGIALQKLREDLKPFLVISTVVALIGLVYVIFQLIK